MSMRRRPPPPWKRPSRVFFFLSALVFAYYMIVNMPAGTSRMQSLRQRASQETTVSKQTEAKQQHIQQKAGRSPTDLQKSPDKKGKKPSGTVTSENNALEPTAFAPERLTQKEQKSEKERAVSEKSNLEKIIAKLPSFSRLFLVVGIASFLGALIESRNWHMVLSALMGKLTRLARLPAVVGLAMPTAFVSSTAANSIIVSSYSEGQLRSSALVAGGMANSYLSYISHSLRVMYPVIGAIGLPGLLYFLIQFSGGFFVILGVFAWNRWYISRKDGSFVNYELTDTHAPKEKILSWKKSFQKATVRSLSLLFRLVYISVPLMLGIEWMLKTGTFDFWDTYIPAGINAFFPMEAIYIVATQIGGLIQSAAVSSNLRAEGLIDNPQILLAMLVGSAVGNPIRTLRRNLPSALAIFPVPIAITIVFSMQFSRFVITIIGILGCVAYMQYLS